jgi:SAM-dependent methyltransferase
MANTSGQLDRPRVPDRDSANRRRALRALLPRAIDAMARRVRYGTSLLGRGRGDGFAAAALTWLLRDGDESLVPESVPGRPGCPGATGGALATAWAYGQRDTARRWANELIARQRDDGSLSGPQQEAPSLAATGHAARGWLALADEFPEAEAAAFRACEYLHSRIDARGRVLPAVDRRTDPVRQPAEAAPSFLPALAEGGRRWSEADWLAAVRAALDRFRGCHGGGAEAGRLPPSEHAWRIEAALVLDLPEVAADIAEPWAATSDGCARVPARFDGAGASSAATAHFAALWYRLGHRDRGDRALRWLARRQNRSGGFSESNRRGPSFFDRRESTWAAKHALDAALLQVQTTFEQHPEGLPTHVDPDDGRMQAVRAWMAQLPEHAIIADVGCGRGRFLRHLLAEFPRAQLIGIDCSEAVLADVPPGVSCRRENLLRLSLAPASLDGALAVESIEHALVPEQAVAELCRAVRPGGRVLIIDKHQHKQVLSHYEPWERWLDAEQVVRWLQRACGDVSVRTVAHQEGRGGRDLFFAASGIRCG